MLYLSMFITFHIVENFKCSFRFGEMYGAVCTLATNKDGNLENKAHTVEIDEYLQKEKERYNNQVYQFK